MQTDYAKHESSATLVGIGDFQVTGLWWGDGRGFVWDKMVKMVCGKVDRKQAVEAASCGFARPP